MTRYVIQIRTDEDRLKAAHIARSAPAGTRCEFKASKRTLSQNDLLWDRLTAVALQKEHNGRKYTPDQWKLLFLAAIGREVQFIEGLDGQPVQWGRSSSDLSKAEMSELLDFIGAYGAEHGIVFRDTPVPR